MSSDAAKVSVLIPVLNEESHIEDTVDAVLGQSFSGQLEVFLIDGGSDDRTPEILARLTEQDPRLRVLANPQRQIPHALNLGLREATGEYVVRMDAHANYPSDYIARGVERLAAGDVECVSGPPIPEGEGKWSRRVALAVPTSLGMGGGVFRNPAEEIEVDTSFTGVWRRQTLVEVGGWDEGWAVNEDSELCARIQAAGGRYVSIPQMAAGYVPRDSLRGLARQYFRYGKYRAKTARRHPGSARRSHVLPPALVLALLLAAIGPDWARRAVRPLLGAYAGVLAVASARAGLDGAAARDAAALPAVYAVMHMAWGAGYLFGCLRFGFPAAAVASLLRGD
jgi:glycosyltransferase involved in cell wall biosynthesis